MSVEPKRLELEADEIEGFSKDMRRVLLHWGLDKQCGIPAHLLAWTENAKDGGFVTLRVHGLDTFSRNLGNLCKSCPNRGQDSHRFLSNVQTVSGKMTVGSVDQEGRNGV